MKIALIYYSGTGNTESMADAVEKALQGKADVVRVTPESFGPDNIADYDAFAFGCPAMGQEVLEEDAFEPMFTSVENSLGDKKVIIFGSYGWGDGEWMRNWEERCQSDGITLAHAPVICQEAPDDAAIAELEEAAQSLL